MKCVRVTLVDRRDLCHSRRSSQQSDTIASCSPRRYCQKRMANPTFDLDEWATKYAPEMYHLDISVDAEYENCGILKPLSVEMQKRSNSPSSKAFLSVSNIDLPTDVQCSAPQKTKHFSKYKTLPKDEKGHLHRMFVRTTMDLQQCDYDDSLSRISSDEDYQFDDYLRLISPEDVSKCYSPWLDDELSEDRNSISDSGNLNDNDDCFDCSDSSSKHNISDEDIEREKALYKRKGKRRSITLSRPPSPETIQVIRVDVVSNYSVESDAGAIVADFEKNDDEKNLPNVEENETKRRMNTKRCKKVMLKDMLKTSISISTPRDEEFALQCKSCKISERPQSAYVMYECTSSIDS